MTQIGEREAQVDKPAIRNAATVIVVRDGDSDDPRVLMGQRGAKAAFMPNKFVFPGGAMDAGDRKIALGGDIAEPCRGRLQADGGADVWRALCVAAARELWASAGHGMTRCLMIGRALPRRVTCPMPRR